ncbi:MAG: hypothetical protein LBT79_08285 [Elusimicrobiota bacterium]|jgi:hypothetical protein|nr:hypothetical protein [Elusimicrobiota bacterium]
MEYKNLSYELARNGFKITLLQNIESSYSGFLLLAEMQDCLIKNKDLIHTLMIDCSNVSILEGNLYSVLGAILDPLVPMAKCYFNNMKVDLIDIGRRNGFLKHFDPNFKHEITDSTIQYKFLSDSMTKDILNKYINEDALKKTHFPDMTDLARKNIVGSLAEVIENAVSHGDTKKVFVCGHYFADKEDLKLTITDLGRSIKTTVNDFLKNNNSACEAISWALNGNTTKSKETPGGLGLKLIQDFLKLNKGTLQIISQEGFLSIDCNSNIKKFDLNRPFLGTIVNIVFKANDNKRYYWKGEKKESI